jgi:hypothetical protein
LLAARAAVSPRPSFVSCFLRAYALVCMERPELRRCYLKYPWPRLYEHPGTVASVAVEREYNEEKIVLIGRIQVPEELTLQEVDDKLRHLKDDPIEENSVFRRARALLRLEEVLNTQLVEELANWPARSDAA